MSTASDSPRRRRRGAELEHAILDAAWTELAESGFTRLTMESVAARAGTGIAVLYRRWPKKDELVLAALDRLRATHPVELPDTGSLRDDLIGALSAMGIARSGFFAATVSATMSGLLAETGITPSAVRERILGDQSRGRVRDLFRRAHERGEIDLDRVPQDVIDLPFDLVRHDLVMTLEPLSPERIRSIVDDLTMPLLRHYSDPA